MVMLKIFNVDLKAKTKASTFEAKTKTIGAEA